MMNTLGELFDAMSELAQVTHSLQEIQTAIGRGGDRQTIERKYGDYARTRDHMSHLRSISLHGENESQQQELPF